MHWWGINGVTDRGRTTRNLTLREDTVVLAEFGLPYQRHEHWRWQVTWDVGPGGSVQTWLNSWIRLFPGDFVPEVYQHLNWPAHVDFVPFPDPGYRIDEVRMWLGDVEVNEWDISWEDGWHDMHPIVDRFFWTFVWDVDVHVEVTFVRLVPLPPPGYHNLIYTALWEGSIDVFDTDGNLLEGELLVDEHSRYVQVPSGTEVSLVATIAEWFEDTHELVGWRIDGVDRPIEHFPDGVLTLVVEADTHVQAIIVQTTFAIRVNWWLSGLWDEEDLPNYLRAFHIREDGEVEILERFTSFARGSRFEFRATPPSLAFEVAWSLWDDARQIAITPDMLPNPNTLVVDIDERFEILAEAFVRFDAIECDECGEWGSDCECEPPCDICDGECCEECNRHPCTCEPDDPPRPRPPINGPGEGHTPPPPTTDDDDDDDDDDDIDEPDVPLAPPPIFTDVGTQHWAHDYIVSIATRGIMQGVAANIFEPETTLNRAMAATILWRLAGEPATQFDPVFTDVRAGQWYSEAITWGSENGILMGIGQNLFNPSGELTREQFAALMFRFAQFMEVETDVPETHTLSIFADYANVSEWAIEYTRWAHFTGLITGFDAQTLLPGGTATRAQTATILYRFTAMIEE
jgi:hypothetical protein